MSTDADTRAPQADGPIELDTLQRAALIPQVEAFLEAAREPEARALYAELREAVDRMEVAPEMAERLGAILEVSLSSGRIRRLFGPGAETSLTTLFHRTPQGRRIAASTGALNAALARLAGQTVEEASVSPRSPGSYALALKTSGCRIVIRFEQAGVRVESLEVDLA